LSPGFPLLPSDRRSPFLFVLICFSYLQCELEIMFHLEKAHVILEEIVMNGLH
jgi:hypothetical protein